MLTSIIVSIVPNIYLFLQYGVSFKVHFKVLEHNKEMGIVWWLNELWKQKKKSKLETYN